MTKLPKTRLAHGHGETKLEILNAELKKLADKYGVGAAQIPVAWS